MDITRAAIENNRITAVALLLIVLGGLSAYNTMSRAEDPGFVIRAALILTYFPGASPDRVENLVSDKIEKVIQEIPELDFVTSQSKTGVSIINVNIKEQFKDMRPIWDNLRRKVESVKSDLPDGIIGPIINDEFGDVFGIIVTITGDGFSYAELKAVADQSRDEMLRLGDAAKVDIYGAQDERVFVEYNNAKLAELGLSPIRLKQILESQNIIIPGGNITTDAERIVLEPSGNFESIEDLRRTVISLPGRAQLIYLEDLAAIHRGYIDPPRSKMRSSGNPCLGLAISMREGGDIIRLGEDVKALVTRLQNAFPLGIDFDLVAFQPVHVDKKVRDFVGNLIQAVVVVLVVMLLFLGLRTGLVVASLIPMTMLLSLIVMSFFNIGLDQMSLAALIIALGMLVDNAVVMAESIMVQMGEGKKAINAAVDSARELRIPLLISSLTTMAAFLPIYLAKSNTGEYTAPLFKVVTITLLSSWLIALTMTPLFCVLFLKVKTKAGEDGFNTRFYRAYRGMLLGILRHPVLVMLALVGLFGVSMFGFRYIPSIFFPPSDKAIFTVELELPAGTSIARTEEVVSEVEAFINRELIAKSSDEAGELGSVMAADAEEQTGAQGGAEGVTNWATFIGNGGPRFYLSHNSESASPEYALMIVNATSVQTMTEELIPKIENYCNERFPNLVTTLNSLQLGPPIVSPIQVRISGANPETLFDIADRVKAKLRSIAGTKNIADDWGRRTKKLLVKINQPRARRAGVTSQDIAISLQTGLSGFETTQYREEDEIIPVTLRSVEADRKDIGKLETLDVYAQATGKSVPLLQVADIETAWEPARIFRRNRLKTVTVSSGLLPGVTAADVNEELIPWLDEESKNWGIGYYKGLGGEVETSGKANKSISEQLPIAGMIIILLLVGQFNSIRRPLIILLTIPLGLIGVIIGLLAANSYFGFMTLLGIVSLAGIVINNAIVLLDRIKIEIEENNLEPPRAIVESAQRRLRPILLTTATTIAGLIPLWLGGGPMWEPMAIAIIFGLAFATLLTLGVVPVLYAIFFRVRFKGFKYS